MTFVIIVTAARPPININGYITKVGKRIPKVNNTNANQINIRITVTTYLLFIAPTFSEPVLFRGGAHTQVDYAASAKPYKYISLLIL